MIAEHADTNTTSSIANGTILATLAGTVSGDRAVNKVHIFGYYDGDAHAMRPVLANEGIGSSATDVDTVTVELHDVSGSLVASTTGVLQTNGNVSLNFTPVTGNYYIVVSHRNTVVTSSASLVNFSAGVTTTYDFSTSASQAFADNQIMVDSGVYAMYTGDLNQDGYIDANDFPLYDTDNNSGLYGNYATDMNGDGYVDANDFPIFDSNNFNAYGFPNTKLIQLNCCTFFSSSKILSESPKFLAGLRL